jgi:hypothetical protein
VTAKHKTRLVGEDARHGSAKVLTKEPRVRLVGRVQKGAHGIWVEQVEVRIVVEPGRAQRHRAGIELDHAVRVVGQFGYIVGTNVCKPPLDLAGGKSGDALGQQRRTVVHLAHEILIPVSGIGSDAQPAGKAAGPFVLVVEPGAQATRAGSVHAGADARHPMGTHVGRAQPDAGVHKEAAPPCLVHQADLPDQLFRVQVVVPRPKGNLTVCFLGVSKSLNVHHPFPFIRIKKTGVLYLLRWQHARGR